MTNTSTQICKTSLSRVIASVVENSNSSLRRLDRLRIRWKEDQQNSIKEEECKAELAKIFTTLLKEHANLKEAYSKWETFVFQKYSKNFYFKHNKESTIDDLQKNHAVCEVYKKMKEGRIIASTLPSISSKLGTFMICLCQINQSDCKNGGPCTAIQIPP